MQSCDLLLTHVLLSPKLRLINPPTMADSISSPIQATPGLPDTNGDVQKPESNDDPETKESNPIEGESNKEVGCENIGSKSSKSSKKESNSSNNVIVRRERPARACTARPAKYVDPPVIERRPRPVKREKVEKEMVDEVEEEENEGEAKEQCSKIVTPLVNEPTLEQMPRWKLRSMWELASILNFFNVS